MQLLIVLALLLYGGKQKNILEEVKPVLETFGGEEIKEALKSAEEISGMLSAVKAFSGGEKKEEPQGQSFEKPDISFPLAPIAAVADKDITYSLSKYMAAGT